MLYSKSWIIPFAATQVNSQFPSALGIPQNAIVKGIAYSYQSEWDNAGVITPVVSTNGNSLLNTRGQLNAYLSIRGVGNTTILDNMPLIRVREHLEQAASNEPYFPLDDMPATDWDFSNSKVTLAQANFPIAAYDLVMTVFFTLP
jgi:hypothetical protein